MSQLIDRLRDANECMETDFLAISAGEFGPNPQELWALLSRAAEFVQQLGPAVNEICSTREELIGNGELQRYARNLKRMQLECASAADRLTSRRTQLWQAEQLLRAQHDWQPEY
jgi:hypothetical protein